MSLAEDLLNSLPETQAAVTSADPATEPHIVINADKSITIPEALRRILVQYEHNVETVTFDCPRYWDGHDLSKMELRIIFQRSDGHREPHLVENLRVDESDDRVIHFDWTISGNTTFASGNVKISVCAKLTNAEGVSEREWHTIPNQDLFVNQGMDCSGDAILERNPDVIEYILAKLDEMKNAGVGGSIRYAKELELLAANWQTEKEGRYYQTFNIPKANANSKMDVGLSEAALELMQDKVLTITATFRDGVTKVYAIGDKPTMDFTVQISFEDVVWL